MAHEILTAQRLRELLHYDPETGVFTWRNDKRCGNHNSVVRPRAGDVAGSVRPGGYRVICIDGRRLYAHRVAWACVTGEWPAGDIDHKDGDPRNNRFENLRDGTKSQNIQNQRSANRDSATGVLGVGFDRARGQFKASIGVDGKTHYLGRFDTKEAAHAAYLEAKRRLHPGCTI